MKNATLNTFFTSDFQLATFLFAKEAPLIGIDKTDPKHAIFEFQNLKMLNRLIEKFWSRQSTIEPRKLLDAQKELKRRLYSDIL